MGPEAGQATARPSTCGRGRRDSDRQPSSVRLDHRPATSAAASRLAGDKSISHRLAILGALAEGETRIANFSSAADCASTLRCLAALGRRRSTRQGADVGPWAGRGARRMRPEAPLDAGNSGSTLRMLAGVLAGRPFRSVLTGDASLCGAGPWSAWRCRCGRWGRGPQSGRRQAAALTIDGGRAARHPLGAARGQRPGEDRDPAGGPPGRGPHHGRASPARAATTPSACCRPSASPVERDGPDGLGRRAAPGSRPVDSTVPGDVSSAAFLVVAALILPDSEVRIDGVLAEPAAHRLPRRAARDGRRRSRSAIDGVGAGAGGLDRGPLVAAARDATCRRRSCRA